MMNKKDMNDLVYIDDHGLLGINYYWSRREKYNLDDGELNEVGIKDNRVRTHADIIGQLQDVDSVFQQKGYRLYIKEGYRPKALYELIYQKRIEKYGKEETDSLLNMEKMPHATGKSVDVTLWNPTDEKEVYLRDGKDDPKALFVDFYKGRNDEQGRWYQHMQEYVINTMQDHGFRLGTLREYFHFDYKPDTPRNY